MLYNAEKQIDIERAEARFRQLVSKKKRFELKEKKPVRSISQNSYLHLIFSWFAIRTGYTSEEVKQDIFKKVVNPQTFYEGEVGDKVKIHRWRSTADLDTAEMNLCIDRFRNFSADEVGEYLPEPNDLAHLQEIQDEISKHENKLYL